MPQRPGGAESCLECYRRAFKMSGKNPMLSTSSISLASRWAETSFGHPPSQSRCDIPETCCEADDCSDHCASVCDGFVDCDDSTICSESQCNEFDCREIAPVCFDRSCFGDQSAPDFLNHDAPFNWNSEGLLPSALSGNFSCGRSNQDFASDVESNFHSMDDYFQPQCASGLRNYGFYNQCPHCSFEKSNPVLPSCSNNSDLSGPALDNMLSWCPSSTSCCHQSYLDSISRDSRSDKLVNFMPPMIPPEAFHHRLQNPDNSLRLLSDPHFNHVHRTTPRRTRHAPQTPSSVSSAQLPSSPTATSPDHENRVSPAPTDPDIVCGDGSNVCKWLLSNGDSRLCGASFPDAGALQEHLVSAHVGTIEGSQGPGYYCSWEGCHRPNEPFSQKSKLQGHFLTHSDYKSFSCSICAKPFARQATLERHERSHRGEKPYKCKQCGKSFTDSSELKTHTRTHTGEKPFKCSHPGCNFETGDSSNMSSHKLTHGVRKHRCPISGCFKSFTRPDQLKRHLKTTHKEGAVSSMGLLSPIVDQLSLSFDTTP